MEKTKQEIEENRLNKNVTDNEEEVKPYHNIIINNFHRNPGDFYNLDIKAIDQKNHGKYMID